MKTQPPLNKIQRSILEGEVIEALRAIYDPELPVNIYDLGLIYNVIVSEDASIDIKMTLTSPACPVAGTLPGEVEQKISEVSGVSTAKVEIVWDPPFSVDRIPEHIRFELGLF